MSDISADAQPNRYLSPLLRRPGAAEFQEETAVDAAGVAWHYGDPLGEQRAVETSTVIVDRSHRIVIKVTGADAPEFLNTLLSQKLDDAAAGFTAGALDLDIQGRILHHADVLRTGDAFYLDVPAAQADSFQDFLSKMVFWSAVDIERTDLGILTLLGEGIDVPAELHDHAAFLREVDWRGAPRRDLAIARGQLDDSVDQLLAAGAVLGGLMTYTAERVRALLPEKAADLDDKSIPHEVPEFIGRGDRPGAVHLNKGCYRGQETVGRVENLGRSPRLLVLLHLDGSAPRDPEPGDVISFNGRTVGRLGTVVHDRDFGPTALGVVRRSALDAGELVITPADDSGRAPVSAAIDPDSIPTDEGDKAGREAIKRLRSGGENNI
ncbi:MAG TPA: folate-binding protein [Corynebacterium sp.]|nr:folate-binding protein [Corynebacterium sp.]